jgi:hypothetical protein
MTTARPTHAVNSRAARQYPPGRPKEHAMTSDLRSERLALSLLGVLCLLAVKPTIWPPSSRNVLNE